jgi:hypothetical protein
MAKMRAGVDRLGTGDKQRNNGKMIPAIADRRPIAR